MVPKRMFFTERRKNKEKNSIFEKEKNHEKQKDYSKALNEYFRALDIAHGRFARKKL